MPACVSEVTFEVWGGGGGGAGGGAGAGGGDIKCEMYVSAGKRITIRVGGGGHSGEAGRTPGKGGKGGDGGLSFPGNGTDGTGPGTPHARGGGGGQETLVWTTDGQGNADIRIRAYGADGGKAEPGLATAGKGGPYGKEAYTPAGADGTTPAGGTGGTGGTGGNWTTSQLQCETAGLPTESWGSAGGSAQGNRGGTGGDAGKDTDSTDTPVYRQGGTGGNGGTGGDGGTGGNGGTGGDGTTSATSKDGGGGGAGAAGLNGTPGHDGAVKITWPPVNA